MLGSHKSAHDQKVEPDLHHASPSFPMSGLALRGGVSSLKVASALMPRSTPTTAWFSRLGGVCSIATVRLTNQRSAVRDTTADLILPTKRSDSRIFTQPITGSLTRLSSTSTALG